MNTKNKTIILSIISFALGALIYNYSPIIFQEGNPWPQIKGIALLTFGNKNIIKLDTKGNKYITKRDNIEVIKTFMKDQGYEFKEQLGSGFIFIKLNPETTATAIHKYYSRYYSLWNISEKLIIKDKSLAEELKECLPKSDQASYEKCNQLLDTIMNFDDCVSAGFPILKSNPPQCTTINGKNFIDETNSDWNIFLTIINNCEVKSVFQKHNKLVTLELKDGRKLTAYEPKIDAIMEVVSELNNRCGKIRLSTE